MPPPARRIRTRLRSGATPTSDSNHWRPPSWTNSVRKAMKRSAPAVWTAEEATPPGGSRRGGQAARVDCVASVLDDVEARLEESQPAVAAREVLHERRR